MTSARRPLLDRVFLWIVVIKGIDGAAELIAGAALWIIGPTVLGSWGTELATKVLEIDSDNQLAQSAQLSLSHLSTGSTLFAGGYLLVHGLVKLVLWWAVARQRYRLYPWMIGVLVAFVIYQVVELTLSWSTGLFVLSLFDVVIIVLTYVEYRRHTARSQRERDAEAVSPVLTGPEATDALSDTRRR
ncbi:hypothetical protein AX769_11670 [Frondihabitans sp. PAMC 28766]|uniref:DUF2127 domain-containing protein n=1 Tax=Frondihabitans sp. PAMC 28766 TaxID=1795630 RepID=UPI00078D914B|nr:DUF2127 domain-containing protein [Frondihabitans sp. PAMC 28766]AMM20678.1 hypothetical protein AX769_11670 [Frondihabitans sp. PAMC 28766]